jgi:aminopeptidase N
LPALALAALAVSASAQGGGRPTTNQGTRQQPAPRRTTPPAQQPQVRPTPAPTPTPAPPVAETPLRPGQRARYDIRHYRIVAELVPAQQQLSAAADVTFAPIDNARTFIFELNGSLRLESVEWNGARLQNVVQDQAGLETIGPHVRVDLGQVVAAGQPVTLRFRWAGPLITPEGGPLLTRRLAYVGADISYLMYPARWFPFHDYAADRATSDITLTVPAGYEVAGASDEPIAPLSGPQQLPSAGGDSSQRGNVFRPNLPGTTNTVSYRFVQREPALVGNFAVGRFISRTLRIGGYELSFFVQPGNESFIEPYARLVGEALEFYTQRYGQPLFGRRLVVVQVDDSTLDAYAAPGVQFLSPRFFSAGRQSALDERVLREVAYQWWGHSVGLKAFDDAWLSQGLAEWSSYLFRETRLQGAALETAQRDMLERALMFEQAASIARAPSTLDDQSAAYQAVVFYKGAMVFRMLRDTLGEDKFAQLMRSFYQEFRGRNASIDDFERLASKAAGENLRYFFARWVEGTGVPEFSADYQIIRTRAGKFRARGTVRQNMENLRLPVEVTLRAEGDDRTETLFISDKSEDFDIESSGKPLEIIVDPGNRLLRISDDLRVSVVARRGLELFREGQYLEAQRQLEEALKLDRSNSWIYYNLGLIYLEQRNYDPAIDNFKAALAGNLRPTWIEVWAHIKMGNAYDAKGDRARAVNEYRKAVETANDFDNAQRIAKNYLETPYDPKTVTQQTASGATD